MITSGIAFVSPLASCFS